MINTNSVDFFRTRQKELVPEGSELIIATWCLSNPENIGKIIRLAHNIGAEKVLFIKDQETYRESKIKKTAGFSYDQMNWQFISKEEFLQKIKEDYKLAVLETCDEAKNIFFEKLPAKMILLGGSESHGIPEYVIKQSELRLYIPMPGECKSLNIANALSVGAFEWYRQQIDH